MLDVSNRSRLDVALVEREARALLGALARVLGEVGADSAIEALPLVGNPNGHLANPLAVRALTIGFHLLSLAEQHATTLHRDRARAGGEEESGLFASTLREFAPHPEAREALAQTFDEIVIEPVLTAHPTEARRISALEQWLALFEALGREEISRVDAEDLLARLERLFRTGDARLRKPRVADERDVIIHTLVRVMPLALRKVEATAAAALSHWPELRQAALTPLLPGLKFATWVGGDRDGHPLVTAQVTAESLHAYRSAALELHRQNLLALAQVLSISALDVHVPAILGERIARAEKALEGGSSPGLAREARERNPEEPYRVLVGLILARLPQAQGDRDPAAYASPGELIEDLRALRQALVEMGAQRIAGHEVDPVIRAVHVFGFHLAALDVRQNSFVHDQALEALLGGGASVESPDEQATSSPVSPAASARFSELGEDARLALLDRELESPRPFSMCGTTLPPEAEVAVAPLRVLAAERARWGDAGIGSLIVSMTRDVSDLLVPYLLAREAGLLVRHEGGLANPIPVVPLFETLDDLQRAPAVLDAYLRRSTVRRSLALTALRGGRAPVQQVMLGYSDSNKDAGPCASLWAVHVAQRELLAVGEKHGVTLRFFHGRGGSASRGAGPTFRFLSALPPRSLETGLRLTEQGETIFQKYGTADAAAYNLELLMAGTVRQRVLDRVASQGKASHAVDAKPELHELLGEVARSSTHAYEQFIRSPGLVNFFREATPVDVIERSGIGSRPTRRSGRATLADLRAIPWVFAWAQSRFALTGWFGIGSGFEALERRDPGAFRALCEHALDWSPLRYIVGNASVSVLSMDRDIAALYAGLVSDVELRERTLALIMDELDRTRRVLELSYGGPLEDKRSRIHHLMALRSPSLRHAHQHQIALLRDWRAAGSPDDQTKVALLSTVNAIAAGLRTTG